MAVIHISEAEMLRDPSLVLAKARAGLEIYIDDDAVPLRLAKIVPAADHRFTPMHTQPRLISEILADLEHNASSVTLDDQFGHDLEEVIRSHEDERHVDPWEAS